MKKNSFILLCFLLACLLLFISIFSLFFYSRGTLYKFGESTAQHYYNQGKKFRMYEDNFLLLKLLQTKDSSFKNIYFIDIVSPDFYLQTPFRRYINKNDIASDLKLILYNHSTFDKYDNSFYFANEKYQKYLRDPWDDIMLKSLYCDIIGFDDLDFDLLMSLADNLGGYADTHIYLSLLFLKENGCYNLSRINGSIDKLTNILVDIQDRETVFDDVYAERIVFLYWAGNGNKVKKEWIDLIKSSQNPDLGWPNLDGRKSVPHSTGLALLSILYFEEGIDKQEFY